MISGCGELTVACSYGAFATVIYPAFEAREIIGVIVKGIWTDITTLGKGKKQVAAPSTDSDSS